MLRDTISQCKERLPMPELWRRLGLEVPRQFKSFCSPFREDNEPSASVFQVGKLWFFKDHATGESFDEIGLIQRHTGCDKKDAIKSYHDLAGVEMEVIGKKAEGRSRIDFGRIIAVYDYLDANGSLVHQTVRYEPKRFLQRRPAAPGMRAGNKEARRDPQGRWWIWTLEGIEPVLYNLPRIINAPVDQPILLCEGEKDADEANNHCPEFVATTNPMGAGKWRKSYTEILRGRDVILAADTDEAGQKHVLRVAAELKPGVKRLRIIDWNGHPVAAEISGKLDMAIFIAALNGITASLCL